MPQTSILGFRFDLHMCKSKMAINATQPSPRTPSRSRTIESNQSLSTSNVLTSGDFGTGSSYSHRVSSSVSTSTSLSSLRDSLPENPHVYDFSEICQATNNFLAKRHSTSPSKSSAAAWRCSLRRKDVILFKRKFRRPLEHSRLRQRLAVICRSHHKSIVKLLGASISGDYIYLVYEFIDGANLADCLRNPRNPNFTVLSSWISRMQIAHDLSHGLDYIHNNTGFSLSKVHNHIKSSSVIVTEPSFNAKLCHFGTAELCGEIDEADEQSQQQKEKTFGEITEISESDDSKSPKITRSRSTAMQFQGTVGYMSPEFQSSGNGTLKSDVYAFGVVILELLSGEEPLKYKVDKVTKEFRTISVIETAREMIGGETNAVGGTEGRLRTWIDRRLRDSFPVQIAEKLTRLALDCVHVEPEKRPDMRKVAGKISRLYNDSKIWSERMTMPSDFSFSMGPR